MAIQVNGTQVIGNSRELTNIASVDATTVAAFGAAGVGGSEFASSWSSIGLPAPKDAHSIHYANNLWVMGMDQGQMCTSTDGLSWSDAYFNGVNSETRNVFYFNGNWFASMQAGQILKSSTAASGSWSQVYNTSLQTFQWATDGNNTIKIGCDGGRQATSSNSGASWSLVNNYSQFGGGFTSMAIAYGHGLWMSSGSTGNLIWTSPTGNAGSWTSRYAASQPYCYAIASNGSISVAVGTSGNISRSTNGTTWTSPKSPTNETLRNVVWVGTHFVAVGSTGALLISTDGDAWTGPSTGHGSELNDVAYDGTDLLIASRGGGIRYAG
jgi:hypothetical protein